jgi:hypothetical protein
VEGEKCTQIFFPENFKVKKSVDRPECRCDYSIKMDMKRNRIQNCGLDSSGSG